MKSIIAFTNVPLTLFRIKTTHYASLRPVILPSLSVYLETTSDGLRAHRLLALDSCTTPIVRRYEHLEEEDPCMYLMKVNLFPDLFLYKTAQDHFSLESAVFPLLRDSLVNLSAVVAKPGRTMKKRLLRLERKREYETENPGPGGLTKRQLKKLKRKNERAARQAEEDLLASLRHESEPEDQQMEEAPSSQQLTDNETAIKTENEEEDVVFFSSKCSRPGQMSSPQEIKGFGTSVTA